MVPCRAPNNHGCLILGTGRRTFAAHIGVRHTRRILHPTGLTCRSNQFFSSSTMSAIEECSQWFREVSPTTEIERRTLMGRTQKGTTPVLIVIILLQFWSKATNPQHISSMLFRLKMLMASLYQLRLSKERCWWILQTWCRGGQQTSSNLRYKN